MAQFIPFDNSVEVRGETVIAVTKGINGMYKNLMIELLEKNGIYMPEPAHWYKQTYWLNTFKDINNYFGPHILYKIGKAIPDNAIFPQGISNLKDALNSIDIAYKKNHRGGEIGYYKLINFNEKSKLAYMECKNPYPCHFDRGIITKIATKFKPKNSNSIEVFVDPNKKGRLDGEDCTYYFIKW